MKIETKFNIGEKVWTIDTSSSGGIETIEILSSTISGITIEKDGRTTYFFDEWCVDYYDDSIVAYDDSQTLVNKIIELDNKIKESKK